MKLSTKISLGFGAIVAIAATLGLAGFWMFSNVSGEVSSLTGHHLPAVQYATAVERAALGAILEEKQYRLKTDKATEDRALQQVAQLREALDKVDRVARANADAVLGEKAAAVRGLVDNWEGLFKKSVNIATEADQAESAMRIKGRQVSTGADALLRRLDEAYTKEKEALRVATEGQSQAYASRMNLKSYMLYGEERFLVETHASTARLEQDCGKLETLAQTDAELELIAKAKTSVKRYSRALAEWLEAKRQADEGMNSLEQYTREAEQMIEKLVSLREGAIKGAATDALRLPLQQGATQLVRLSAALENTQVHLNRYVATKRADDWDEVIPILSEASRLLSAFQASNPEREAADALATILVRYRGMLEAWNESDSQMTLSAVDMDDAGDTAGRSFETFLIEKTKVTENTTQAVLLATQISRTLLNVRLASRRYMMTLDKATWDELVRDTELVLSLYGRLDKLLIEESDHARVRASTKLMRDYLALSEKWRDLDRNLREKIQPEMTGLGTRVLATAREAEDKAWAMSDDRSGRVQSISRGSRGISGTATALAVLAGIIVSVFIIRSIMKPLRRGVDFTARVADGDLTHTLESAGDAELRQLADSMNRMVDGLRRNIGSIADSSRSLSSSAEELSAVSSQVSSGAEETASQAGVVSAAAEQVSKSLNTVATGTEQMSASVREISHNAAEAARVATEAAGMAVGTNATVAKLGRSSEEIGSVIKVITSIAEQTNLLALNATIEAARAGAAGKGFAVVAGEVKELARQTATATSDIHTRIQAIQSDSKEAMEAIQRISAIIDRINAIQTTIAGSVEEQAATTNEIARNIGEAARGASEIAGNIHAVTTAARSTTEGASQTAGAAQELARLAAELRQIVANFRL